MKTLFRPILLLSAIFFSFILLDNSINNLITINPVITSTSVLKERKIYAIYGNKPLRKFLNEIGKFESGNNYTAVNSAGFLGKYQFNLNTVKGLGLNPTKEEFLTNPRLQDEAMIRYMKNNEKDLKSLIKFYSGTYIDGVLITKSGILAGAHLGGSEGIKKYLISNGSEDISDSNGASMKLYLKKFSGYNLSSLRKI